MKNLNVPQPLASGSPASRFQAAKAMAFTLALADSELHDSCMYFGPGPVVNFRDDKGNEMICRIGGVACMPLD